MKLLRKVFWLFALLFFIPHSSYAGVRGPGTYVGTVIFDRWGGCTLYNGSNVMYISEKIKQQLLPYKNEAIQILAIDVSQPMNPGDGLIKKFEHLSTSVPSPPWVDSLVITTSPAFQNEEPPSIKIEVKNTSKKDLRIYSENLAPTLLTTTTKNDFFSPSDGPSVALVTRVSFWSDFDNVPRLNDKGIPNDPPYIWTVEKDHALLEYFSLKPGETRQIKISFHLPKGEYEFLCGYGVGVHQYKCVTSNLTPFDVDKEGNGKIVTPKAH
ncbi:MAG: hypothetical protein ABI210_13805 [Abditibacteriaceae bacterium]